MKVLIVDDDPDASGIVSIFLKASFLGISIEVARNGLEAIDKVKLLNDHFDAIITDFRMPGMNGREMSKILKGNDNVTAFILLTGDRITKEDETLFNETLGKPPDMNELVSLLKKLIGS